MLEQFGLGNDDILFTILLLIGMGILYYWLQKIYRRIRQIALIMVHFLKEFERSSK